MKTNNSLKENHPEAKKKLRLPDQLELVMEDGTVYRFMLRIFQRRLQRHIVENGLLMNICAVLPHMDI